MGFGAVLPRVINVVNGPPLSLGDEASEAGEMREPWGRFCRIETSAAGGRWCGRGGVGVEWGYSRGGAGRLAALDGGPRLVSGPAPGSEVVSCRAREDVAFCGD